MFTLASQLLKTSNVQAAGMQTDSSRTEIERPYLKGIVRQLSRIEERLKRIEEKTNRRRVEPRQEYSNLLSSQIKQALEDANSWVIVGRVVDASGRAVEGVEISLFDADRSFDEQLGTVPTDENGDFCVFYRADSFQQLVKEQPDLYLEVIDQQGQVIYAWEIPMKFDAGRFERFDIQLEREDSNESEDPDE